MCRGCNKRFIVINDNDYIPPEDLKIWDGIVVASVDSPFRELVSWAYMHVDCRPGLPVRRLDEWCQQMCKDAKEKE
jgi:hypothetical protein